MIAATEMQRRMEYKEFAEVTQRCELTAAIEYLAQELKYKFLTEYRDATPHPITAVEIVLDSFTYTFDDYGQSCFELADDGKPIDGRLIAAFGTSKPDMGMREVSRLRSWIGATERYLGRGQDKGHFIAHTIGGRVDGFEINLFSQLRHINRGWSAQGKIYRQMERYCAGNPGTFCFSRPFYSDQTCRPTALEFGILLPEKTLWVEQFDN